MNKGFYAIAALLFMYSNHAVAQNPESDAESKQNEGYIRLDITLSSCSKVWFGDESHHVVVQPSGGVYTIGSNTSSVYNCETDGSGALLATYIQIHNYYSGAGTISNNKLTDNVRGVILSGGGKDHQQSYNPPLNLAPNTIGTEYHQWAEAYWVLGGGGKYADLKIRFIKGLK